MIRWKELGKRSVIEMLPNIKSGSEEIIEMLIAKLHGKIQIYWLSFTCDGQEARTGLEKRGRDQITEQIDS